MMRTAIVSVGLGLLVSGSVLWAQTQPAATQPAGEAAGQTWTTDGGVKITQLDPGGTGAEPGDTVWVHYVGKLLDGPQFDSSHKHGAPVDFELGQGIVIEGWEQGVQGMKVGEKRTLVVPPELGYGIAGFGNEIPPNATLVFEVELVGLKKASAKPQPGEAQ